MAHLGAFKNMFEEIDDSSSPAVQQGDEEALGRAESGFVGLDNQGATCYLNALLQAIYMTPELRHGLYAVDPKDLGGEKYEAEREQDRENEKARLAKERARLKKQEKEGRMQPDPEIVKGLLDMSFSENGARRAALKTKNKSFNAALDWAMEHSEDKDFEDPLPGYDDDDVAGGGKKEGEGAGGEDGGASGKKKKGSKSKNAKMIPLELQRLFARLQLLDARTVSTEDLTERGFKWKNDEGRMQHDAHELIRLLIDRLERDMKLSKVNAGLVSALYEGDLANQVKCLHCGHVSERREKYRDVLLQVAGQEDLVTSLLSYTRPERLSGDNKYFCDQCQEKQDALRSQTLRALPPVLIFSLNRFEFDFETMERVKVKQEFKYPLTLDMEPFVEGRAWSGNDNSDESQVPELAGDPEASGTCRNRQKWVPQAWNDAKAEAITLQTSLAATSDQRQRQDAKFEGDEGRAAGVGDGLRRDGEGGGGGGLVYELLAVVVHRGSAYSGHYHALIRDCLQEGRWLPPSGLNPSQPADAGEDQEKDKEGIGLGGDGGGHEESKKSDGSLGAGTGLHKIGGKKQQQQRQGPMEVLLEAFEDAPKHQDLGKPCMRLSELRSKTRSRLDGKRWDKVFKRRLDNFIKDHADVFMLQEIETGGVEVLLLHKPGGGEGDAAEPPAGNAGESVGGGAPVADGSDPELEEVLRLSLQQQQQSAGQQSLAPANGTALADTAADGDGGKGSAASKAVPPGAVDALASEKHGRWFSFDDRKVTPISIRDLQKPFEGAETAYLLIYRSRSLDQEADSPVSPADIAAAVSASTAGSGGPRNLPGGLHMTSVPPSYWMDKVDNENDSLKTVKDSKEADLHCIKITVWVPKLLQPQMPHLVPLDPSSSSLDQLPEPLRSPLVLHLDDRQTVKDLKKEVVRRLGEFCRQMGVSDMGRARLSELTAHGPGMYLSNHLPDKRVHQANSPRRRSNHHRNRRGSGGGRQEEDAGATSTAATAPTLGDLDWGQPEGPLVLLWDGRRIGGVEVPDPSPESRPIRLVVSVLKASEDVDQSAWIDNILEQAGGFGRVPERRGSRAETSQTWNDLYTRAGVTASEVVELVSNRGLAEVSTSKMCISLLRGVSSAVAPDYVANGRKRASERGGGVGAPQMEAVQIAGPSGVFEEWKASKSSGVAGRGGAEAELAGLELSEGSELLVEEQGAVNKLIAMTEFSSLAEMEAARRSRLVRVEVEVDDDLVETLRSHNLPLAHDVAVATHEGQRVLLNLECDVHATSIPHLKALCLLGLVPTLKENAIPSSQIQALLPPPPPPARGTATATASGAKEELALVGLVKTVRLENTKSGNALDESSTGASLFATRITEGAQLMLLWGAPPATGKALVKFYVRVGNSTATARDPARSGSTFGPLEVIADLKEPVSALKARMIKKAAEMTYIVEDDQERRIRLEALLGDSNTLVEELKDAADATAAAGAAAGAASTKSSKNNDATATTTGDDKEKDPATSTSTSTTTTGKGKGKGKGKRDNGGGKGGKAKAGDAICDGGEEKEKEEKPEGGAEGEGDAGGGSGEKEAGAASKSKKKKKKKKGGGGGGGKDGTPEDNQNNNSNTTGAAAADKGAIAEDNGNGHGHNVDVDGPLFQDRLVEESGILGGQEIYLEDGRVPRPRELEITVLAYAPHFLGLAAAASAERLKAKVSQISDIADGAAGANVGSGNGDRKAAGPADAAKGNAAAAAAAAAGGGKSAPQNRSANRSSKAARGGGEGGALGSVPTGLSPSAVWPDEEAARKMGDVERFRGDPVRLLSLQRQLSMRTLGHFHIDERRSLTELRAILRGLLSEGLRKATKASMAEAMRAAKEAQAAAEAAAAAVQATTSAGGGGGGGGGGDADGEVMDANELEDIRKIMMMKNNKNPSKLRKKRSSHGRGGGAGAHGNSSSSSTTTTTTTPTPAAPTPPPLPASDTTGPLEPGTADAPNGHGSSSANGSTVEGGGGGGKVAVAASIDREGVKEVKEEHADSDDEIPLPEGLPGFEALEEAMLVRELRKDRLPGKIIRGSDVGGNTAGGLFVGQPISELNLCSSVALVLCLRPRLPQTPLVQEASMSRREKLAKELLENGQANSNSGTAEEKGPTLEEQKQELQEAKRQLEALEANLQDLQKKREVDNGALEMGLTNYNKALRNTRSPEQDRSMKAWKKELNARKERIDNTHLKEERPLDKEVKSMRSAVEKMKRSVKKMEKEEDREKATAQGLESASIFTRVKGVLFSGAKATFGFGRTDDAPDDNAGIAIAAAQLKSNREQESIAMEKEMDKEQEASDWGVPKARGNANSSGKKSGGGGGGGGGKGAGKKSAASSSTGQPGSAGTGAGAPEAAGASSAPAPASGGPAAAAATAAAMASPETTLADLHRKREDEVERRRTDPATDLHLWTFWRKNPLGDGGTLPIDEPEWPGPLKEVIVEDVSQPTLDNLHEALGKAYGIPASRVRAIKHNWGKHQWVRLTREMGVKKMKKGKKGKRLVTNLREAPYSFKDGDVVAVVDKMEDESGEADLARADDEAYREHGKGQAKAKKDKRKKKKKPASKRAVPEVGLTLGGGDWDDGDDDEESDESDESDDLSDMRF